MSKKTPAANPRMAHLRSIIDIPVDRFETEECAFDPERGLRERDLPGEDGGFGDVRRCSRAGGKIPFTMRGNRFYIGRARFPHSEVKYEKVGIMRFIFIAAMGMAMIAAGGWAEAPDATAAEEPEPQVAVDTETTTPAPAADPHGTVPRWTPREPVRPVTPEEPPQDPDPEEPPTPPDLPPTPPDVPPPAEEPVPWWSGVEFGTRTLQVQLRDRTKGRPFENSFIGSIYKLRAEQDRTPDRLFLQYWLRLSLRRCWRRIRPPAGRHLGRRRHGRHHRTRGICVLSRGALPDHRALGSFR
jgi:hypothetical protein